MNNKAAMSFAALVALSTQAEAQQIESISLELLPIEKELDSVLHVTAHFRPFGLDFRDSTTRLTDDDYREVARELGVEPAAIKAVVDIETGHTHQGFWKRDKPLINFDLTIYRRMARRRGVDLQRAHRRFPVIFNKPNVRRYGSRHAAQQARLDAAMEVDKVSAIEGTFWGMFQIGGFNWKKCGVGSIDEFVELMSRSERDQLELFAQFCVSNDLVKYIRDKNWAAFSLRYNGPGYAARGYHTKMANAYRKFKKDF